ncbi:hypothetical protein NLU13_3881 [Sarocladium strictum]|uniref:RNA polymerase-associated protein LEO1 n=1 Tax=Sarocladium strictum TaxID=5046 RepID=A0AA39GI70_SARSR|nr:hypothetical protein NLU13_3881 [Sarocladium strictum]
MSDSEDPIDPIDEDGGDDLFGDDDDNELAPSPPKARDLDDDSLASDPEGDDAQPQYSRDERARSQSIEGERRIMEAQIHRHRIPKPSDKTLRVMRIPKFLKVHPIAYEPENFQPTEFDVANALSANPQQVMRYRKDRSTGELKSNTNVYRWSDGSITISVGGEHYEVSRKALGPPADKPYSELQDGHYYAASVELSSNLMVTVDHITEQYNVRPNKEVGDEALTRLAERMAEATNAGRSENMIIRTTKDPEMQKRQAELAEKEREKARRRRENAAAKMDGGPMGRSGGRGGLSIGDLEGRRGAGAGRKRGVPGAGKPKRRRPEYDSDDDLPQGVGRHEEYDRDGFVVGSDDEEMDSDAEEDEEEILDDDEEEAPRRKRQRTVEADEDASGDEVEPAETSTRARRRNIIDDEDDE